LDKLSQSLSLGQVELKLDFIELDKPRDELSSSPKASSQAELRVCQARAQLGLNTPLIRRCRDLQSSGSM